MKDTEKVKKKKKIAAAKRGPVSAAVVETSEKKAFLPLAVFATLPLVANRD